MIKRINHLFLAIAFSFSITQIAYATTINGGSSILDANSASQLESFLGSGTFSLTNIFTKQDTSTSFDFHSAADGQGATFVLMSVTGYDYSTIDPATNDYALVTKTIGAYNPLSWNSTEGYQVSGQASDRTAFLFNLSDNLVFNQNKLSDPISGDIGAIQTFNDAIYGPSFGAGPDLSVDATLTSGYSYLYSYTGDNENYSLSFGYGAGLLNHDINYGADLFQINKMEVFTMAQVAAVPEPKTFVMLLAGLALIAFASRKRLQS